MMKQLIRIPVLTIIGLTLLVSCKKDEATINTKPCSNEYFYYATADSKIYLTQSSSEMWIVFEQEEVSKELAESILNKYAFIANINVTANNYHQMGVRIDESTADCAVVNGYLKVLNEDDEIFSATPVFYLNDDDPDSYYILLSEVVTKNDEDLISEADFIDYAESLNLELIEAKYSRQHFRVKDVKTGFEALEIANQIFESGKAQYANPNCIMKIELY